MAAWWVAIIILVVVVLVAVGIGLIVYFVVRGQRRKTPLEEADDNFDRVPGIQCPIIPGVGPCIAKNNYFVYPFNNKSFRINQPGNTYITLNGALSAATTSGLPQWSYNGSRIYNSASDRCLAYTAEGILAFACRDTPEFDFLFDGYNFYLGSGIGYEENVLQLAVTAEGVFGVVSVPRSRIGVPPEAFPSNGVSPNPFATFLVI